MNRRVIVALGLALVLGIAIGIAFTTIESSATRGASGGSVSGQASDSEVLYWHDPMVPGTRFDKPGKSPFMDMQLVPVYADEGNGAAVRIDSSVSQNLGIRLGKVERREMQQQLRVVGSVAIDERRVQVVQARVGGTVTRLFVKSPFEPIKRGQALAEILSPEWLSAQQEYLALLDASGASAASIRGAARERLTVLGVPEEAITAIEKTRKTHATTTMLAPSNGVLAEIGVREGSSFAQGTAIAQITNLEVLWVQAQVPESQLALVPMNASVAVRAAAWSGERFDGKVIGILPNVDPQTRTVPVRVEVNNENNKLLPGMFVALDVIGPAHEKQLAVPSEAIIMTGERSAVIVARDHGGFDVIDVTTAGESESYTAIAKGLTEGQSVVLSGQFLIDSEASLRAAVHRLSDVAASTTEMPAADALQHLTQGTIEAITDDQITITHEPVPSLNWPAMTMGFKKPARGLPKDLAIGDRVTFSFFKVDDRSFQIEAIAKPSEQAR
jgi:Cu(I)/Ag(I) efflux system membrane fusion protein